jgi:hypothetical protein
MKILAILFSLLTATVTFAQTKPEGFASDFTPSPCASTTACTSFKTSEYAPMAAKLLGLTIDSNWVRDHESEMAVAMGPTCQKIATCYTIQGALYQFCHDSLMPEIRAVCPAKFAPGTHDFEECRAFTEIWIAGVDQLSRQRWQEAQACAKPSWTQKSYAPEVWIEPATVPRDYSGRITVFAVDPQTKLPVPAEINIDTQNLYTSLTPTGRPTTYYPFKWTPKLVRVPNADGHRDLVAPTVTVTSEGWAQASFKMPIDVPKMIVEMKPSKLKPGQNHITVTTRDAATGQPVETRVMFGTVIAGESNKEFALTVPKGKHPDLWVTDLYERYSDVVVAR